MGVVALTFLKDRLGAAASDDAQERSALAGKALLRRNCNIRIGKETLLVVLADTRLGREILPKEVKVKCPSFLGASAE